MGRENGSNSINVDASRLAVVGDSVGGNMAAAVTLLAKERGGPNISHQVLFYPVTNANFESQSYNTYQEGYWLTREAMKWFWNNYAPDDAIRKNPLLRHCRLQSISSKGYHRHSSLLTKMMYCATKVRITLSNLGRQVLLSQQLGILVPYMTYNVKCHS